MSDLTSRTAARDLAVAYSAFNQHRRANETNGVIVWGGLLIKAQKEAGLVLIEAKLITALTDNARAAEALAAEQDEILATAAYHRRRNATMWRGNDRELMEDAD